MWTKNRIERRCGKMTWKNNILQYTEPAHTFKSHEQMTGFLDLSDTSLETFV